MCCPVHYPWSFFPYSKFSFEAKPGQATSDHGRDDFLFLRHGSIRQVETCGNLAVPHHDDPVGKLQQLGDRVADEDDRQAFVGLLPDDGKEIVPRAGIQPITYPDESLQSSAVATPYRFSPVA